MPTNFTPAASPAAAGITRNSPPPARGCTRSTCDGIRGETGAQRGRARRAAERAGTARRRRCTAGCSASERSWQASYGSCMSDVLSATSLVGSPMTVRLVAGVDSSTQSTKVEVRDLEHRRGRCPWLCATSPRPLLLDPNRTLGPGGRRSRLPGRPPGRRPSRPSASRGQQHGMVVLDADRQVIRPAKLWNDTETAPDADG